MSPLYTLFEYDLFLSLFFSLLIFFMSTPSNRVLRLSNFFFFLWKISGTPWDQSRVNKGAFALMGKVDVISILNGVRWLYMPLI